VEAGDQGLALRQRLAGHHQDGAIGDRLADRDLSAGCVEHDARTLEPRREVVDPEALT